MSTRQMRVRPLAKFRVNGRREVTAMYFETVGVFGVFVDFYDGAGETVLRLRAEDVSTVERFDDNTADNVAGQPGKNVGEDTGLVGCHQPTSPASPRPCWYCCGSGTLPFCEHTWVPSMSGRDCALCGQPENWTASIVRDGDGSAT